VEDFGFYGGLGPCGWLHGSEAAGRSYMRNVRLQEEAGVRQMVVRLIDRFCYELRPYWRLLLSGFPGPVCRINVEVTMVGDLYRG